MNEQQDSETRLDAAIDRAVRQFMSAEPPAGLRQRVLARLADPPAPLWHRWGGAAAAVAAIVLTVVLMRPGTPPSTPSGNHVSAEAVVPSAPAEPLAMPAVTEQVEPAPARVTPERRARIEALPEPPPGTRVQEVFGPPPARIAAASVETSPVPYASGDDPMTDIESLLVPAIAIPPLVVPPLTIPPFPAQK
jgi:hypothetical protein